MGGGNCAFGQWTKNQTRGTGGASWEVLGPPRVQWRGRQLRRGIQNVRHPSVAICCNFGARVTSTTQTLRWHQRLVAAQPSSVAGMPHRHVVVGGCTIKWGVGAGSFGKVFCAVKEVTGEAVALKFVLACGSILIS